MPWLRYKTTVSKTSKDFYLGVYAAQHKGASDVAEGLLSLYKELKLQPPHAPTLTYAAPGSRPKGAATKRVRHGVVPTTCSSVLARPLRRGAVLRQVATPHWL